MFWSSGLDLFLTAPMIFNIIPNNIYQKAKLFRLLPKYFPTTNPFEFTWQDSLLNLVWEGVQNTMAFVMNHMLDKFYQRY